MCRTALFLWQGGLRQGNFMSPYTMKQKHIDSVSPVQEHSCFIDTPSTFLPNIETIAFIHAKVSYCVPEFKRNAGKSNLSSYVPRLELWSHTSSLSPFCPRRLCFTHRRGCHIGAFLRCVHSSSFSSTFHCCWRRSTGAFPPADWQNCISDTFHI